VNDTYALAVLKAGRDLGITPRGIVIGFATVFVESEWLNYANAKVPGSLDLPHDAVGSDGMSVGLFQQQVIMGNGWWWGPVEVCQDPYQSALLFFGRLKRLDYNGPDSPGSYAQAVQQSAYPDRYDQRMADAQALYDRLSGQTPSTPGGTVGVSGDPVWLEDVLRPKLGGQLKTLPGWESDGVGGTMGQIWGVIWHHTGNAAETAESISQGRPDLQGPLAQIHIAPDGTVTIVAVGPCNHAGAGSWPGLPTDGANAYTIGIECAWPRNTALTEQTASQEHWPDAQIIAMRKVGAALTKYLGVPVSHNISHKEWARLGPAGQRQYKWDPGNLDMDWFRGEIHKDIDGAFDGPGTPPVVTPPAEKPQPVRVGPADDQLTMRFNCLGGKTLVEAIAQIRDKVCGTEDRDKEGVVTL
jgi:hypothetical protein